MNVGLRREDGEQDVVELVLGHRERVVRSVNELADLVVVPPHHLQQLAQVRFRLSNKFCDLEFGTGGNGIG